VHARAKPRRNGCRYPAPAPWATAIVAQARRGRPSADTSTARGQRDRTAPRSADRHGSGRSAPRRRRVGLGGSAIRGLPRRGRGGLGSTGDRSP
jgi:hypothetical protein